MIAARSLKALLAMPTGNGGESAAFLVQLKHLGLDYHLDDNAAECLHGNGLADYVVAVAIGLKVETCFERLGDPHALMYPLGVLAGEFPAPEADA